MAQVNFAYGAVNDVAGLPLALSIYADRVHLRDQLRDDAAAAGLHITEAGPVALLLEGDARPLGQVVLLDCPLVDGTLLAALTRLDLRAAHCGAQLIVSTTVAALDDVFGCLDQSQPQILVDPGRAERMVALGRALARSADLKLRELSEEDRLLLLRLTEQVSEIAQRLEHLESDDAPGRTRSAFRFESPRPGFATGTDTLERLAQGPRPALPDPRLVRRIIRQRQLRARFFEAELFGDPAWDMLLDLTAARAEHGRVSVTSLCIASGVPPTTALRWIGQLIAAGLFQRSEDVTDRRRAFITLTDRAADLMARYFAELGNDARQLV